MRWQRMLRWDEQWMLCRAISAGLLFMAGLVAVGCKTDDLSEPRREEPQVPLASLENPEGMDLPGIPIADRTEADLVEQMVMHRAMYARYLQALVTYYTERGNPIKASWARSELNDLRRYVKPYRYISDAEVPDPTLRPKESIAEADQLYNEAQELLRKGGHGVPIFYNQTIMKQALAKLKELIERYPTSDKIDDAAFWIGKIHKEYFEEKDNLLAIEWYKRCLDWNPNTPWPARFEIAVIYDYRMHERENALYWYQQVLEKDSRGDQTNVRFAQVRIGQLTTDKTRYAQGDVPHTGTAPQVRAPRTDTPPAPRR